MGFRALFVENKDLFPTKWSLAIFVTYMGLFVSQGLLVTASRMGDHTYPYNPTVVVLLTETLKLSISASIFIYKNSFMSLLREGAKNKVVLAFYMVPASLYCLYNNLAFANLASFDPTTYFMFMQTRLLLTGLIYQFLFKRPLSGKQWLSLLVLTAGCLLQKLDLFQKTSSVSLVHGQVDDWWSLMALSTGFLLVMVQVCCSVFAGVYNEYIIKNLAGQEVDIMLQNVFMYLDSIVCNVAVLGLLPSAAWSSQTLSLVSLQESLKQPYVVSIIVNNALVGIVTSLFLKNLNSIVKAFASAIELIFTAVLSFLLLAIPLKWNTMLAVAVVSYAVVMYAQNPVKPTNSPNPNYSPPKLVKISSDK